MTDNNKNNLDYLAMNLASGRPKKTDTLIGGHTQGPWRVGRALINKTKNNRGIYSCDKDGEFLIAEVQGNNPDSECGHNARLIAAAPELLNVAIWLDKFLNGKFKDPDIDGAKDMVAAIISKATVAL